MNNEKLIAIIMGSDSDAKVMAEAVKQLKAFGFECDIQILSAHRSPTFVADYAKTARSKGIKVIIAGAGGAAHLAGAIAAKTSLPVIGVPIKSSNSIDGWDSLLSTVQMPTGIPVATVAIDGAANAAILAVQILGTYDNEIASGLDSYKQELQDKVLAKNAKISEIMAPFLKEKE